MQELETHKAELEPVFNTKQLWLVPTWRCNRRLNPCSICFASQVMEDAERNGYQDASADFFDKVGLVSSLPWKDVVITGGEVTVRPAILEKTLTAIDPKRNIRIISDGDFALDDNWREFILDTISSSERKVRMEISCHDGEEALVVKLKQLSGRIPIGVQFRTGESGSVFLTHINALFPGIFIEQHRILNIGRATQHYDQSFARQLKLRKLIDYSGLKNHGIYIVPGNGGTRIIANHEAPYLVGFNPADICQPEDQPEETLRKIIDFYTNPPYKPVKLENDKQTLAYILASFNTGVPLELEILDSLADPLVSKYKVNLYREVMAGYYQILAAKMGFSIEQIKVEMIAAIASQIINRGENEVAEIGFNPYPVVNLFAESPPKNITDLHRLSAKLEFMYSLGHVSDEPGWRRRLERPTVELITTARRAVSTLVKFDDQRLLRRQLITLGLDPRIFFEREYQTIFSQGYSW